MALSVGSRIGPYEVLSSIGAGGMGEVFRARDARLKRDVALKVLPAAAVGDADRLSRFEREAQVLASLNHPAIAQVFGVEMDGDSPVIVMELVEGDTLAERLARGAVPLGETLPIALQLCDGIEAAHERGVIHRDLKPANIKVRPDGTVKILDFGLARVLTEDAIVDASNSPTVIARTGQGTILGTAAYMSPEQARAKPVDKRADIWAFGCVVYEMLAGTPAFTGETTTDILANIVQNEPDWKKLPAGIPARIVDLLDRCLQKLPKDRLRDIADARFRMIEAMKPRAESEAVSGAGRPSARASRFSWLSLAWLAAGAALTSAVFLMTPGLQDARTGPLPVSRTVVTMPADTTLALSRGSVVAISPDGRTLVFAGKSLGKTQLFVRAIDDFNMRALAGTEDATNPFFSPDGKWVGFVAQGKLKKLSLEGGAPIPLADITNARGEVWGADDTIYVTPSNNVGLSRVKATGGKLEPFTTTKAGELSHRWPTLLPNLDVLLYAIWNDVGWDPSRIAARRIGSSDEQIVVPGGGGYPHYVRDSGTRGFLVYARSEGLMAAPFDESRLAVTGQAVPVVDGVIANLSGGAHFDLSASGTLVFVPGTIGEADRDLTWFTADGKAASETMQFHGMTRYYRPSPDGTRVAKNNASGLSDIWIEDLTRRTQVRLTNAPDRSNYSPIWSADGTWVIFIRGVQPASLYARPADGRDIEVRLSSDLTSPVPFSVSPDGKALLYGALDPATGQDIWMMNLPDLSSIKASADVSASTSPRPLLKTNAYELYPAFSPDGKWIAYQSNETGRFEVYARAFPDGQQSFRVSPDGAVATAWSATGRDIYFRSLANSRIIAASVTTTPQFQLGLSRELFDASPYEPTFAVVGGRFLMMPLIATEQSAKQINIITNFLTELRQRVK